MNRASLKAYEYLSEDKVTADLVAQYLKNGKPIRDVAVMLRAYMEALPDERKQSIYRQLYFTAVDATTWGDVANYMYADLLDIPEIGFHLEGEDNDEAA